MDEGYSKDELYGVCTLRAFERVANHDFGTADSSDKCRVLAACCAGQITKAAAGSIVHGDLESLLDPMALGGENLYDRSKVHTAVDTAVDECIAEFVENDDLVFRGNGPDGSAAGASKSTLRFRGVDVYTDQGRRTQMEDKHVAFENLNSILLNEDDEMPEQGFFGVYDGHGGVEAASYTAAQLHHVVAAQSTFKDDPVTALREGFKATDAGFLVKADREALTCGATACAVLLREKKLYVAWLGDSQEIPKGVDHNQKHRSYVHYLGDIQAMLCRKAGPVQLMVPHKPNNDDEKARIEAAGGVVVWYGAWRVNGVLSVARAIGDKKLKEWVIGDPDVKEFDLDGTEEYLILACDGLWDVMDEDTVHTFVTEWQSTHDGIEGVAEALVKHCIEDLSSTDNVSLVVVFF